MTAHLLEICDAESLYDLGNRIADELMSDTEFVEQLKESLLNLDYDSNPEFRHWRPYCSRFEK